MKTSIALGVALLASVACSKGSSGITPTKKLPELTEQEWSSFCAWKADGLGGYGAKREKTCDQGGGMSTTYEIRAPASLEQCLKPFRNRAWPASCVVTVKELEACAVAMRDYCGKTPEICKPIDRCMGL